MKRLLPARYILCTAALLLAGCAQQSVPTATASRLAPRNLPVIGVSLSDVKSTDTALIQKGIGDSQRKNDVSILYRSADGQVEKQATDIADLVRLGVAGLIVLPVAPGPIVPALDAAREKGIPIVVVDTLPPCGKVDVLIRADWRANGREAAKYAADKAGKDGPILVLATDDPRGRDFTAGAAEIFMKTAAPSQTTMTTPQTDVAAVALRAVRDDHARAIIAADDALARTASAAVQRAGLRDTVTIVGAGGTRDAIAAVLSGELNGDLDTRPQDEGAAAVVDAAALVRKKQPPADLTINVDGVDVRANAVAGRLITRDNARDMQERWPDLPYAPAVTPTPQHR